MAKNNSKLFEKYHYIDYTSKSMAFWLSFYSPKLFMMYYNYIQDLDRHLKTTMTNYFDNNIRILCQTEEYNKEDPNSLYKNVLKKINQCTKILDENEINERLARLPSKAPEQTLDILTEIRNSTTKKNLEIQQELLQLSKEDYITHKAIKDSIGKSYKNRNITEHITRPYLFTEFAVTNLTNHTTPQRNKRGLNHYKGIIISLLLLKYMKNMAISDKGNTKENLAVNELQRITCSKSNHKFTYAWRCYQDWLKHNPETLNTKEEFDYAIIYCYIKRWSPYSVQQLD